MARLRLPCAFSWNNPEAHSCLSLHQLGSPLFLIMNLLRNTPANLMNLVSPDAPTLKNCHPVIFDCLDGDLIRRTVLRIEGSGCGPLGGTGMLWAGGACALHFELLHRISVTLWIRLHGAFLHLLWTQMLCSPFSIAD